MRARICPKYRTIIGLQNVRKHGIISLQNVKNATAGKKKKIAAFSARLSSQPDDKSCHFQMTSIMTTARIRDVLGTGAAVGVFHSRS